MSNLTSNHKNKRILQIIPNMEIGGAERTVLEITSFLKKRVESHVWLYSTLTIFCVQHKLSR